jgi:hypothetical protein
MLSEMGWRIIPQPLRLPMLPRPIGRFLLGSCRQLYSSG